MIVGFFSNLGSSGGECVPFKAHAFVHKMHFLWNRDLLRYPHSFKWQNRRPNDLKATLSSEIKVGRRSSADIGRCLVQDSPRRSERRSRVSWQFSGGPSQIIVRACGIAHRTP